MRRGSALCAASASSHTLAFGTGVEPGVTVVPGPVLVPFTTWPEMTGLSAISPPCNVGFSEERGRFEIEIKGLVAPKSEEAQRICQQGLNEVIATFVQDKNTIERGLFDPELIPEELTQLRMGKIVQEKYPELDDEDQEAVRQRRKGLTA